jgi:hypothetical protein
MVWRSDAIPQVRPGRVMADVVVKPEYCFLWPSAVFWPRPAFWFGSLGATCAWWNILLHINTLMRKKCMWWKSLARDRSRCDLQPNIGLRVADSSMMNRAKFWTLFCRISKKTYMYMERDVTYLCYLLVAILGNIWMNVWNSDPFSKLPFPTFALKGPMSHVMECSTFVYKDLWYKKKTLLISWTNSNRLKSYGLFCECLTKYCLIIVSPIHLWCHCRNLHTSKWRCHFSGGDSVNKLKWSFPRFSEAAWSGYSRWQFGQSKVLVFVYVGLQICF